MKLFKILVSLLLTLFLFSFCVLAETYPEYTIDIPEGFVSAGQNTDKGEIAKLTGMSAEAVENYFTDNNLLFFAADNKNTTQIKLSANTDSFSEKTVNFNYLEDEKLIALSGDIFAEADEESVSGVSVVAGNGLKFLKRSEAHKDSGGNYVVTSYVTVVNGENYRLSVFCEGTGESELADDIFKTLKIYVPEEKNDTPLLTKILIISGIAVFASVAVITAITLIKTKKELSH